jgi:hypothetical protein
MPKRLLSLSAVAGLTVAGTVASMATPAAAAPVTTTVDVPVTCTFSPSVDITPRFAATVKITAPAKVRARRRFAIQVSVATPPQTNVPVALNQLSFTNVVSANGARPAGPFTYTQAPVDVPQGGSVTPQVFTQRLNSGASGSTITYTLNQHSYTFTHVGATFSVTSTCTPDAGGPVTIATTRVTR